MNVQPDWRILTCDRQCVSRGGYLLHPGVQVQFKWRENVRSILVVLPDGSEDAVTVASFPTMRAVDELRNRVRRAVRGAGISMADLWAALDALPDRVACNLRLQKLPVDVANVIKMHVSQLPA